MINKFTATAVENIPDIVNKDDLTEILLKALNESNIELKSHDILVIAHKIFNKTRGTRLKDRDKLRFLIKLSNATKLMPKIIDDEVKENFTYYDVNILEKEWAPAAHKLKEDPTQWQVEQYKKLCESIDKHGMQYPIIVSASDYRVLRGNQRVWYCIDNNIDMIGAYAIGEDELDRYVQKTYVHKSKYPL